MATVRKVAKKSTAPRVKKSANIAQGHKEECGCPICKARRGERGKTKGAAFFSLSLRTLSLIEKLNDKFGGKGKVIDAAVKALYEKVTGKKEE